MSDVLLAIGTAKGLVLARTTDRASWQLSDLQFPMNGIYATAVDTRGATPRLLVSADSSHWGPAVLHSDDLGATWAEPDEGAIAFPADADTAFVRAWALAPSPTEPDVVWAGSQPSALFRSEDRGEHFELVRGLWDHPHRPQWGAGFGGQAIHTVLPHPHDPSQVLVAMSSGGVYRTEDAGTSWTASNTGVSAYFLPDPMPEFGQCVHKVARDCADPDRLYPAEPSRRLPQRRRRAHLDLDRRRAAGRLRVRDRRPSAPHRRCVQLPDRRRRDAPTA